MRKEYENVKIKLLFTVKDCITASVNDNVTNDNFYDDSWDFKN